MTNRMQETLGKIGDVPLGWPFGTATETGHASRPHIGANGSFDAIVLPGVGGPKGRNKMVAPLGTARQKKLMALGDVARSEVQWLAGGTTRPPECARPASP